MKSSPLIKFINSYCTHFSLDSAEEFINLKFMQKVWAKRPYFKISFYTSNFIPNYLKIGFELRIYSKSYFPFSFSKKDLIEHIKEEMKQYSDPSIVVAKDLKITPAEKDVWRKKIVSEETSSKDYICLKEALGRLINEK